MERFRFFGQPIADLLGSFVPSKIRSHTVLSQGGSYSASQCIRLLPPFKEIEHHRGRQNRAQWIGDTLPSDVGRGAVHRLKE